MMSLRFIFMLLFYVWHPFRCKQLQMTRALICEQPLFMLHLECIGNVNSIGVEKLAVVSWTVISKAEAKYYGRPTALQYAAFMCLQN